MNGENGLKVSPLSIEVLYDKRSFEQEVISKGKTVANEYCWPSGEWRRDILRRPFFYIDLLYSK
jgi:hypothetical protein